MATLWMKKAIALDAQGRIESPEVFMTNGQVTVDKQRENEYTRLLSSKIVSEYHRINWDLASHRWYSWPLRC